jgi:antitoxin Xre/MbcA/ParS-like protein
MANPNLFKTVSNQDSLQFWQGNALNYQKVRDFTGFDVRDIARMTGAAKSSVRFDSKAPKEVREHLENIANICNLVFQFFQDDVKTKLWLQTPNPMLGNVSPRDMLRFGRYAKLLRFINQAIEEGGAGAEAPQTSTAST